MFHRTKKPSIEVEVSISKSVLNSIFDECDKYDSDETGGRLVGVYEEKVGKLYVRTLGVIEPGPNAKRSATSFFQDGNYQEQVFREIEKEVPEIEHLGNWHTHHVNGHPTLSSGDVATYQRTVNHKNHNLNFFYTILVVEKYKTSERYKIKHHLLRRNDPQVYEIPDSAIQIVDEPSVWPIESSPENHREPENKREFYNKERVTDQQVFSEFYPRLKPFLLKDSGVFYWKGGVDLIDGSSVNLVLMESEEENKFIYEMKVVGDEFSRLIPSTLSDKKFKTARKAVRELEQHLNRKIFLEENKK